MTASHALSQLSYSPDEVEVICKVNTCLLAVSSRRQTRPYPALAFSNAADAVDLADRALALVQADNTLDPAKALEAAKVGGGELPAGS